MKSKITDFNEATCQLYDSVMIFIGIYSATNGDPCTTGCCYFDHGKCPGFKKLKQKAVKHHIKTNAEIGAEINETPRQVSKMRKNGTLPVAYK